MTDRYPDAALDLSLLPAPAVIKDVDYEAIKAARLADFVARMAAIGVTIDTTALESEPAAKLQEVDGYREMLDLQSINDAAKSVMMLYARGSDQDNIFPLVGARRLMLVPAQPAANPPVAAVMEGDGDYQLRAQVALDGSAPGLTGGGYAAVALRASSEVKRVSLVRGPEGSGTVHVVLQGRRIAEGGTADDGSVSDAAVRAVAAALADDWSDDEGTGSQMTDIPMVQSAVPLPYDVVVRGTVPAGPAYALVESQSRDALSKYGVAAQIVGDSVPTDALIATGRVASMIKMTLVSPPADVVATPFEVPWMRSCAVTVTPVGAPGA